MKRRSFTGPFWLLLVFGLLQGFANFSYLHTLLQYRAYIADPAPLSTIGILSFFLWPAIVLAEALVYWLIRRRNNFRALSWTHSVIFVLAFFLNIVIRRMMDMDHRPGYLSDPEYRVNQRIWVDEQRYIFRGLMILAHVAFVAVLANCFRKTPPVVKDEGQGQGQENLLDDVVL